MNRYCAYISIGTLLGILVDYFSNELSLSIYISILFVLILVIGIYILIKDIRLIYISLFLFVGIIISLVNRSNNELINKDSNFKIEILDCKIKENYKTYIAKILAVDSREVQPMIKVRIIHTGKNTLKIGDVCITKMSLSTPESKKNPHVFNFSNYLKSQNVSYTSYLKDSNILKITKAYKIKFRIRDKFDFWIDSRLNKLEERNYRFLKGIFVGNSSYLSTENLEKYRSVGLAHILAVSGLHIDILASFILKILINFKINKKLARLITIITLLFYGYIIGFPISFMRALIMNIILFLSFIFHLPYDRKNAMYLAAFLIMIINPSSILGASFQLSFGAIISMEYFSIDFFSKEVLKKILSSLISIQLGLLPLTSLHFGVIRIIDIFSNLIILPIVIISIKLAFLYLIIPIDFLLYLNSLNMILNISNYLLDNFYEISELFTYYIKFNIFDCINYYIIFLILINLTRMKQLPLAILKLYNFIIGISIIGTCITYIYKPIEVHFIDVGQGDCALIKGNRNYLIDTGGEIYGGYSIGENVTLPYLLGENINVLENIYISHYHADHCRGLFNLTDKLKVKNLIMPYIRNENKLFEEILDLNINKSLYNSNSWIKLEKNVYIKKISPTSDYTTNEENNMSLVLLMDIYGKKVLFTGDIHKEVEENIVENLPKVIDILKVPHHGSDTSSSDDFLSLLDINNAVISVGENNKFNHPSKKVLKRYKECSNHIFRTDLDGRILFKISRRSIRSYRYLDKGIKNCYIYNYLLNILNLYLVYIYLRNKPGEF